MAKTTPSYTSVPRERQARRHRFRKRLYHDKMPVLILFMAALVGVLFEKAVNGVQALRIAALAYLGQQTWLLAPAAFVLSALLAMMGYAVTPWRPAVPAFLRLKARWRICGRCADGGLFR